MRWLTCAALSAVVVAVCLTAASCTPTERDAGCADGGIVALGDSITAGTALQRNARYPAQLARLLGRPVCNAGVDGDTASDMLARLDSDALRSHPAAVVVLAGANDCGFFGDPTEPALFTRSLEQIIERIRSTGAAPVLASLTPIDARQLRETWVNPGRWSAYDALVRGVAEREAVPLVDLTVAFGSDLTLLADGLHPNARGAATIAKAVAAVLEGEGLGR